LRSTGIRSQAAPTTAAALAASRAVALGNLNIDTAVRHRGIVGARRTILFGGLQRGFREHRAGELDIPSGVGLKLSRLGGIAGERGAQAVLRKTERPKFSGQAAETTDAVLDLVRP